MKKIVILLPRSMRALPVAYPFERTGPAARCPSRQCSATTVPRSCQRISSDFIRTFGITVPSPGSIRGGLRAVGPLPLASPVRKKGVRRGTDSFGNLKICVNSGDIKLGANLHLVRQGV